MKFKGEISKINEQGVKAKEDNPMGEKPPEKFTDPSIAFISDLNLKVWQEAEANRKEYDVKGVSKKWFTTGKSIQIGDRIEGDIINNEIVNVKFI